ncbi:MAG: Undecaprenyl-diphosphatase [Caulobacteraceae bacterium]|nr:Undecaprenyl-diphosphatase [Caulobacteraceae bacterium]
MDDWLAAVFLGLIEGLTEFIPVSSTGHLLLAKEAMGLRGANWDTFIVMIQLGAILAVTLVYFGRLWRVLLALPTDAKARMFALTVIIACIPAVVLGFIARDLIKTILFESPMLICASLLIGGVVLLAVDRFAPEPTDHDAMRLPLWKAIVIGLFQCLSLIPGVSRSGSTIVGSMLLKIDRRAAAEFSFFLAIPIMVGAFGLDFIKNRDSLHGHDLALIAVGFVTAFLSGLVVVRGMLAFIGRYGLAPFAWWRIAVGGVGIAILLVAH